MLVTLDLTLISTNYYRVQTQAKISVPRIQGYKSRRKIFNVLIEGPFYSYAPRVKYVPCKVCNMYLTWYQLSALHCWIWIGWLLFIALNHSFRSVSDQIMGFEFQRVPNTHQHPCVHVTACCRAEQLSGGDWAVDRQSDHFVPL